MARKFPGVAVVLCPNVMLCEQVVEMANSLCDDQGNHLLKVSAVCGRQVSLFLQMFVFVEDSSVQFLSGYQSIFSPAQTCMSHPAHNAVLVLIV